MEKKDKNLLLIASLMGFLAVAIGAYGAHGLKGIILSNDLPIERLDIFKTGVSYQFYHTLGAFIALLIPLENKRMGRLASKLFFIGIILFSGSLYLLAIREFIPIPTSILGPMTPVGGLFFMAGWITLFLGILKDKKEYPSS